MTEVVGKYPCGYCGTGNHGLCPGSIAGAAGGRDWVCPCGQVDHVVKEDHGRLAGGTQLQGKVTT